MYLKYILSRRNHNQHRSRYKQDWSLLEGMWKKDIILVRSILQNKDILKYQSKLNSYLKETKSKNHMKNGKANRISLQEIDRVKIG
jgi:hypothetical protein